MKSKRNAVVALGVAVLAAISVAPTGSAAFKPARWCPEGSPVECQRIDPQIEAGERGAADFVPAQVRPKIQPVLTRNAYGRQAFGSGGWMME